MADAKFTEEELRRMAQSWFAEARATSAKDAAEVSNWVNGVRQVSRNQFEDSGWYHLWPRRSLSTDGNRDGEIGSADGGGASET